jgi:hypothetical protein
MEPACPVCVEGKLSLEVERAIQMCVECARKYGVRPMPPALRPPAPCQRCSGLEFVRTVPREYSVRPGGELNVQIAAPMFFTATIPGASGGGVGVARTEVAIEHGYGQLEMYACLGCGFVEWYVHGARDIPIHPHLMTEKIDYGSGGPYR